MDAEIADRVIEQAFQFWINPEIERRRAASELRDDFALYGAQVVFDMDTEMPEVRLNEEVNAVATVKAARAIEKGEAVTEQDIDAYEEILLTERDPNAGHLTIIAFQGGWALAFDFRRNAARVAQHAEVAGQFLDAAAWARAQGHTGVFVDTLFSATELMAKGFLIQMPDRSLLTSKKHRLIKTRFNYQRRMHNVDERFVELLNRLWDLREPARYLERDYELGDEEMAEMLTVGREMHGVLEASRPKRAVLS